MRKRKRPGSELGQWQHLDLRGQALPCALDSTLFRDATELRQWILRDGDGAGVLCYEARSPDFPDGIHVAVTDPKVHGGSFSTPNLRLLRSFIAENLSTRLPFVLILSTGGVRITHARSIFQDVFGAVPDLFELRRRNPLITVAIGKALGIGALFFGLGHFRIAATSGTLINLTGPRVVKGYFGDSSEKFETFASAGHQYAVNSLVQELRESAEDSLIRVRELLRFIQAKRLSADYSPEQLEVPRLALEFEGEVPDLPRNPRQPHLRDFMMRTADFCLELFPGRAPNWRTYLCRMGEDLFGMLIHPPMKPDNIVGVGEVQRAKDAVQLFRALRIPLISAVNSPGGDPRARSSDADIVMHSLALTEELSSYPYPKIGLILERCYGGIGLFTLPTDHGSNGLFFLPGGRIGVMSDSIIDSMIPPNSGLRPEWEKTKLSHKPDMSDLVESGDVQGVLNPKSLREDLRALLWPQASRAAPEQAHPRLETLTLRGLPRGIRPLLSSGFLRRANRTGRNASRRRI